MNSIVKKKKISGKIYTPTKVTTRYTDGTETVENNTESPLVPYLSLDNMDDIFEERQDELYEKRKAEGRCLSCGSLRDMTPFGLKDCEICTN